MAGMPKISISVNGEEQISSVLGLAAEGLDFKRIGRNTIAPFMERWTKRQFQSEGGHGDGPDWDRYSNEPKYRAYKRALLSDGGDSFLRQELRVLRWKRGMERLYPSLTDESHPDHIRETREDGFTYGTSVPYAERLSEKGGTGPFGEAYPPRPIFRVSKSQRVELFTEIQRDIQKNGDVRMRLQV